MAARIAGASDFGAYALGLATAGVVATYMGLGVGAVATRFGGRYPKGSPGYNAFLRILLLYSSTAALATVLVLFAAAGPLARILYGDGGLERLVQVAAVYGGTLILFETLRGLAIGLLDFRSVVVLSAVSGVLMIIGLTIGAFLSPAYMLVSQGVALGGAILVTVAMAFRAGDEHEAPIAGEDSADVPTIREVVRFGAAQLGASVGFGIASWSVAVFVSRVGQGTEEMGHYALGNQLNNLVTLLPVLISQLVFPLIVRFEAEDSNQERVVTASTYLTTLAAVIGGGSLLLVLPFIVGIYGDTFSGAIPVGVILIGAAILSMAGGPAGSFLMVANLRAYAAVMALLSIVLILSAWRLVPSFGAAGAGAAWLIATFCANLLVIAILSSMKRVPPAVVRLWWWAVLSACTLIGLSWLRFSSSGLGLVATLGQALFFGGITVVFLRLGQGLGYLPDELSMSPRRVKEAWSRALAMARDRS
jgi:O-antigen/teichoic acid export membrane protein